MRCSSPPRSRSLFRGQSRTGIGEGPGQPVLHGEQFLAVDPPLGEDGERLARLRPWLTLDSSPADRRLLGDRLEAWSCFPDEDLLVVARLAAAGTYDRRAAYFTHARSWPAAELPAGFDPGLLMGRSGAFEPPWRDGTRGEPMEEPSLEAPGEELKRLLTAEREVAERLLSHLHRAVVTGVPVVAAIPVAEFVAGGTITSLVAFARAALPADLKRCCRLRIYTRLPQLFLECLGAHLLVVPEEAAGDALAARRDAVLLDRRGGLRAGEECPPGLVVHARQVVQRALALPEGLLGFSERYEKRRLGEGIPDEKEAGVVPVIYNLAYALEAPEERLEPLLGSYLLPAAERLQLSRREWGQLMVAEEWDRVPRPALSALLRRSPEDLEAGGRELQAAAEAVAEDLGLVAETSVETADLAALERLLDLYARPQPLETAATVAAVSHRVPLGEIEKTGRAAAVLAAELTAGVLEKRQSEADVLARMAEQPEVLQVLARATSQGVLGPGWAERWVAETTTAEFLEGARVLLPRLPGATSWGDVCKRLLTRLRELPRPPVELLGEVGEALRRAWARRDLPVWLWLNELRAFLSPNGSPPPSEAGTRELLSLEAELGGVSEELSELLFRELDRRFHQQPQETTEALVDSGWWYFWRRRVSLSAADARDAALAWMRCSAWQRPGARNATLEAWEVVVRDLQDEGLASEELRSLAQRGNTAEPSWPWIPPFEERQVEDLAGLALDAGALAELAARGPEARPRGGSIAAEDWRTWIDMAAEKRFGLKSRALAWLVHGGTGSGGLPVLHLEECRDLLRRAGCRRRQALEALSASVLACLDQNAEVALRYTEEGDLWRQPLFRRGLRRWLVRRGRLDLVSAAALEILDRQAAAGWEAFGEAAEELDPACRHLAREAAERGLDQLAGFLDPTLQQRLGLERLAERGLEALLDGRDEDPVWTELRRAVITYADREHCPEGAFGLHPLSALAVAARDSQELFGVAVWETFVEVLKRYPTFFEAEIGCNSPLPAFELAAALLDGVSAGNLALRLAFLEAGSSCRRYLPWWRALVASLGPVPRRGELLSTEDREDVARALLAQALDRLPSWERNLLEAALWPSRESAYIPRMQGGITT